MAYNGDNAEFNPKAIWFHNLKRILIRLDNQSGDNYFKIPREIYQKSDEKTKTLILKKMLNRLMDSSGIPQYGNILCFLPHSTRVDSKFEKNPSMEFDKTRFNLHCWGCMEPGITLDIFDIIGLIFNLKSFPEKKRKAIELFVEDGKEIAEVMRFRGNNSKGAFSRMNLPTSMEKALEATTVYIPAEKDSDCQQYLKQRGITLDSAKKFNLKCWNYKGNKYLVIPCDDHFYTRRKFVGGSNGYSKFWNKNKVSLFNGKCLKMDIPFVFVVESAIDAINLDQMGYPAVAINGIENYSRLIDKADIILNNGIYVFVLMDNDSRGVSVAQKITTALKEKGIQVYLHVYRKIGIGCFLSGFKDLNEAYVADPLKTAKAIEEIIQWGPELNKIKPAESSKILNAYPNPLDLFFGRSEKN